MLRGIISKVNRLLIPQHSIPLGRWNLKHKNGEWQNYLNNYHGDPGYANLDKTKWIEKLKKIEKIIVN